MSPMVPINYLQENLVDKNNENYLKTIKIDFFCLLRIKPNLLTKTL